MGTEAGCCGTGGSAASGSQANDGEGFVGTDEMPVFFTASAAQAVKEALANDGEEGDFLRVSVVGGGCSGYQYGLDFDKEERMGDVVMEFEGVKVVVDTISAGYLRGTTVDFVSGIHGKGFQFKNPNAKRTCGCGSSFS